MMPVNAYYLITYALNGLPNQENPALNMVAVSASTFIEVEDYAFSNVPSGYFVMEIEKGYETHYGIADIVITDGKAKKNGVHDAYDGSEDDRGLIPGEYNESGTSEKTRIMGAVVVGDTEGGYYYDPDFRIKGRHFVWVPKAGMIRTGTWVEVDNESLPEEIRHQRFLSEDDFSKLVGDDVQD